MDKRVKTLIRTLQNQFPFLKTAKDSFYFHIRRTLRIPHEADFRALRILPDSGGVYLDVGANHGQSIASIRLFKPHVKIVSFEPAPNLVSELRTRFRRDPNLDIRPYGLADQRGEFTLFTPVYNGFVYDGLASFDRTSAGAWLGPETVIGFSPDKLNICEQICRTETLDEQQLTPEFIKIDVQGLEYAVLLGGRETLARHSPILLVEDGGPDERMDALLKELSYEVWMFNGRKFERGRGRSANRFLMTRARAEAVNARAGLSLGP